MLSGNLKIIGCQFLFPLLLKPILIEIQLLNLSNLTILCYELTPQFSSMDLLAKHFKVI